MGWGRTTAPWDRETTGHWDWAGEGMWQRGTRDGIGDRKRQATAPSDWETSRHGVVNHGLTMGCLAKGSRENALSSRTAMRRPQG